MPTMGSTCVEEAPSAREQLASSRIGCGIHRFKRLDFSEDITLLLASYALSTLCIRHSPAQIALRSRRAL